MVLLNHEDLKISSLFKTKVDGEHVVFELKQPKDKVLILDKGLCNTAICESDISKIDGDLGKLYYRGVLIEDVVKNNVFEDVAFNLIFGQDPDKKQKFKKGTQDFFYLPIELKTLLDSVPEEIHPMDFLSIGVTALSALEEKYLQDPGDFFEQAQFIIAQTMVIATYYYLKKNKQTWTKEISIGSLAEQMLYQITKHEKHKRQELMEILDKLLILHAEHEQNCSTFTVRTVASSGSDVYGAISAGMAAFKGKLHGGASQFVFEMYEDLLVNNTDVEKYIKEKISKKQRIMGLGHRVYNCWDPRAKIMLEMLNSESVDLSSIAPYKNLAIKIIKQVNEDDFFIKRNICPNPDLLNCIFYNFLGVPSSMNTVMLSISRIAGWLAHYHEAVQNASPLIRPRQLFKGNN